MPSYVLPFALVSLTGCTAMVVHGVAHVLALPVGAAFSSPAPKKKKPRTAIDFEAYPHVAVRVSMHGLRAPYDDVSATAYLVQELQAESGFETISAGAFADANLILHVNVTVTERAWSEVGAQALFTALDRAGNVIDSGDPSDSHESPAEAVEDALDLVAVHYRGRRKRHVSK